MKKISFHQLFVGLLISIICSMLMGVGEIPDPTRPPDVKSTQSTITPSQQLELTAIFVYPTYKLAIINGQAVKPGDHIGEYTVTTINPNAVELEGPQNRKEILQLAATIKQRKND